MISRIVLIVAVSICSVTSALSGERIVRDAKIMGTTIHVEVWHKDVAIAEQAAARVLETMEEINQSMSPYIESSELSLVNREAALKSLPISAALYSVVDQSLDYSVKTAGAFDITFASVFVMGPIKGLQLLESLQGIEGIIVDKTGNLLFSSGLQNLD